MECRACGPIWRAAPTLQFDNSTKAERLPDVPPADPFGFNRAFQAFHRLARPFTAERERLVMDRQEITRAGVVRHPDSLLRRAMRLHPGLVSADRHDGQVKRPLAAQRPERFAPGRVAAENNF